MSKFQVGDKVKIIGSLTEAGKAKIGQVGEILDIDWKDGACFVLYPKGQDWVRETDLILVTSNTSDPKREFLERLQSLMREFDARIDFGGNDKGLGFILCIGKDKVFIPYVVGTGEMDRYGFQKTRIKPITPDTIMDFDKE